MKLTYRRHTVERTAEGWKVTDPRGNVMARGLYSLASARREVDILCRGDTHMAKEVWYVVFGGGIGPNTWDNNLTVEADNIEEAIAKAMPTVKEAGGEIFSCEWKDGRYHCSIHIA